MSYLVSLQDVSLNYRKKRTLYDINLTIEPGEFLTVVGPNGAGKTSLLKLIVGLEKPSSGRILRRENLKISYLPQKFSSNPLIPISVGEFIRLSVKSSAAEINRALVKIGLEGFADRPLEKLSGGEMQRVLFAKTMVTRPDLLILDEPGQNIDFNGQLLIYQLIEDIYLELGCSVIMVSHDIHLVMSRADTVICLFKHICCKGKPESISNDRSFISHFGQLPAALLATYRHHSKHGHTHL